jgi:type II secretory pathway pseudopilin PulG
MVVVAIIAILIAIFMPSAGRAREQARRVSCESHLRGIGGAATAFASEHGRVFPMAYQMPDPAFPYRFPPVISMDASLERDNKWKTYGTPWQTWKKYGAGDDVWHCPSSQLQAVKFYDPANGTPAEWGPCVWTDYAYFGGLSYVNSSNHNLGKSQQRWGGLPPAVAPSDPNPSERVLAADMVFYTGSGTKWQSMRTGQYIVNHSSATDVKQVDWQGVLYADGHVEGMGRDRYESPLNTMASQSRWAFLQGGNGLGGYIFVGPPAPPLPPPPSPPSPPPPPSPPSPPPPPVQTPNPLP